ncbi:hypothetical protein Z517_02539 [Fonsecaea pedrosoi CBS 271.37]|uniref:BAH domain-containing protein n=1 Tax=Fonsecaea pedrosoi CBS 271.37 TaxID=1442368 RepID=A0A0D2HFS0_9EURO|nr:uncharacterized protein Z517_02539 [Fonsecaea pedrosoi CBS 271.37]KIW83294.1 hypothetical protein Z517_02539 [Fonsecaea pedrosoi CBS 271.37]
MDSSSDPDLGETYHSTESYGEESIEGSESPETEHRQVSRQVIGRKRRSSEMETEMEDDSSAVADSPQNHETSQAPGVARTIESEGVTFKVDCGVTRAQVRNISRDKDIIYFSDCPLERTDLTVGYTVEPGSKWESAKRYHTAQFQGRDLRYHVGQYVYINNKEIVPAPLHADATEDEKLAYDKKNCWVGLLAEFKAVDGEEVFARVYWLYWPDELPMGRQPYHGRRELVLSNHVEIIEAQSLVSLADVSHWDETDDSNKNMLGERYWRQILDVTKLGTQPHRSLRSLSQLRKFCICKGYDSPEQEMFQCPDKDCGTWNHEACLIDNMEQRAWERFKKGTLTHEVPETEQNETSSHIPLNPTKHVATPKSKKTTASRNKKKPWAGKLEGKISRGRKVEDDNYIHIATIRQLVPQSKHEKDDSFKPVTWNMEFNCLKCHRALNSLE